MSNFGKTDSKFLPAKGVYRQNFTEECLQLDPSVTGIFSTWKSSPLDNLGNDLRSVTKSTGATH